MATDTEKLLVLKAYYMGHAISENKPNLTSVVGVIDRAIDILKKRSNRQDQIRLLFYLLLKAEALRESKNVLEIRQQAKELAQKLHGKIYEYFMAVEDATQSRKEVHGIQTGIIADKGIKTNKSYKVSNGFKVWEVSYNAACRALGIEEENLPDLELKFLRKTTLKSMLKKHKIPLTN